MKHCTWNQLNWTNFWRSSQASNTNLTGLMTSFVLSSFLLRREEGARHVQRARKLRGRETKVILIHNFSKLLSLRIFINQSRASQSFSMIFKRSRWSDRKESQRYPPPFEMLFSIINLKHVQNFDWALFIKPMENWFVDFLLIYC